MFVVFATAFGVVASCLFIQVLIPQLRRCLLDQPNARSSHRQPTPRGGGLSFVVVSSVSSGLTLLSGQGFLPVAAALPLLAAPLAVLGLLDDRYNLSASWRYGAQLLTAALILGLSPLIQQFSFEFKASSWILLLVLFLQMIAFTAIINFINFMDGLDGLVAGCMTVVVIVLGVKLSAPLPLWVLAGALMGFMYFNWSPAKVFMGDVGSTFLGAVFAGLVLQASSWPEAFGCLLVATPLLGDACFCVIRRLLAGQRVFEAHRLHLFQRLHQAGWPHAHVSVTYIASTGVLAIAMLTAGLPWLLGLAFVELLLGAWLDQHVAVPFAVASKS